MKTAITLALTALFLTPQVWAWTLDELRALSQLEADASKGMSDTQRHEIFEKSRQYQNWAAQLQNEAMSRITPQNPKAKPIGVVAFASLGMPTTSLKQLFTQAADLNIPVVIRGLLNNDFMLTAQTVQSLVMETDGQSILGGVEINPVWFKQFNITQVPAFVAIKEGACMGEPPCAKSDYDILYGNISLYHALDVFSQKGDHSEVALRYLK